MSAALAPPSAKYKPPSAAMPAAGSKVANRLSGDDGASAGGAGNSISPRKDGG
jgi:hypothetical protein